MSVVRRLQDLTRRPSVEARLASLQATLAKLDEDRQRSERVQGAILWLPPPVAKVAGRLDQGLEDGYSPAKAETSPLSIEGGMNLLKAAAIGDLAGVNAALEMGTDVNTTYDAAVMGEALMTDVDLVESQLHHQSVDSPDYVYSISDWAALPLDATALILASRAGHVQVVKRLLAESGIDCNKGTKEATNFLRNNQTAMHWASRQGNVEVVRVLLADQRVDVNACTDMGFCSFALAVQQGHLQVVNDLLSDPRVELVWHPQEGAKAFWESQGADVEGMMKCKVIGGLEVLLCGGGENRLDVVRRCMEEPRVREFFFDEKVQAMVPPSMRGCRIAIFADHSPAMLQLWIESGLSPHVAMEDGSTLLDVAIQRRLVEHIRVLLMHNAESTELSPIQRAQVLGNAIEVREFVRSGVRSPMTNLMSNAPATQASQQGDSVPDLHRAVLQGDDSDALAKVCKEIDALGSPEAARDLLDEGKLPALFYAVEVGHLRVARELLQRAHGFTSHLTDKLIEACTQSSDTPGERSFRVCCSLIREGTLERDDSRAAAMAFLKPWCSSLVASRCCEKIESFRELSELCRDKNKGFYQAVDENVTVDVLEQAARVASDAPTGPVRQDAKGIIPPLRFYRVLALRAAISFDHEAAVAQAYALLGLGLTGVFESDVRRVFRGSNVVSVAPKAFQRMQNKLLNPVEHGDPDIPRPRCAKNVDVLRGCIIVKTVDELKEAYDKLQAAFKVVRVKNTHNPSQEGWSGGYRSLLVNFIFEPGLTWAQLFGDKITFDLRDPAAFGKNQATPIDENKTKLGSLWLDFVQKDEAAKSIQKILALQGLQVISSEQPDEPVRMIAELQLVLEPYFAGRAVSHMLFKIARCDTGAMEMVRDFFQEYFQKEARLDERLLAVKDIAVAVNQGRRPSQRVPVRQPQVSNK